MRPRQACTTYPLRDAGMKKVMDDPRLAPDVNPMPYDGRRLIYGGFETIVDV